MKYDFASGWYTHLGHYYFLCDAIHDGRVDEVTDVHRSAVRSEEDEPRG